MWKVSVLVKHVAAHHSLLLGKKVINYTHIYIYIYIWLLINTAAAKGGQVGNRCTHLVCAPPWFACLCEVLDVLLAIHQEVVTRDAELSALVVVIPMPCTAT